MSYIDIDRGSDVYRIDKWLSVLFLNKWAQEKRSLTVCVRIVRMKLSKNPFKNRPRLFDI